jgi:hypothetical protein
LLSKRPGRKRHYFVSIIRLAGTMALQGHDPGSMVYYKNIRIKALD